MSAIDTYFVPVHAVDSDQAGVLRVEHVTRYFRPVIDDDDMRSVESRFYPDGSVLLSCELLGDDSPDALTVRLSPEIARYLAGALQLAASAVDSESAGFPKRRVAFGGSSYGSVRLDG